MTLLVGGAYVHDDLDGTIQKLWLVSELASISRVEDVEASFVTSKLQIVVISTKNYQNITKQLQIVELTV